MPDRNPAYTRKKRVRRLKHMLIRIRGILATKRAEGRHEPLVLQTLEAEIKALEWVLREIDEEATQL